jgi:hypothetical protein
MKTGPDQTCTGIRMTDLAADVGVKEFLAALNEDIERLLPAGRNAEKREAD